MSIRPDYGQRIIANNLQTGNFGLVFGINNNVIMMMSFRFRSADCAWAKLS